MESILRQFIDRPDWFNDAKCRGMNPDIFFPERYKGAHHAKTICASCPVRDECVTHAVDTGEMHGIWGGYSERGRRQLRRRLAPVRHGSNAGYVAHRKRGEPACAACTEAHRVYSAEWRERNTA